MQVQQLSSMRGFIMVHATLIYFLKVLGGFLEGQPRVQRGRRAKPTSLKQNLCCLCGLLLSTFTLPHKQMYQKRNQTEKLECTEESDTFIY